MVALPPSLDWRTYQLSFGSSVAKGGVAARVAVDVTALTGLTIAFGFTGVSDLEFALTGVLAATSVRAKGWLPFLTQVSQLTCKSERSLKP